MKRSIIVLWLIVFVNNLPAQNTCTAVNNLLDTVHSLNKQMKNLGDDSARIRQFVKNYRGLNLLGDTIWGLGVPAVIFSVPPEYTDSVGTCLLQRATQNNWFIAWNEKDEDGFRGFNLYDSPGKKNRILYYRRNFLSRQINLAISLSWQER